MREIWLGVVLLAATLPTSAANREVQAPDLGIRFSVPGDFIDFPEAIGKDDVVYAYRGRGKEGTPEGMIAILVKRLSGRLPQSHITTEQMRAKGKDATVATLSWQSLEIDRARLSQTQGGLTVITYSTQVPIKPQAVQLMVAGVASRDTELEALSREILGSLVGESTWLTEAQKHDRYVERLGQVFGFVLVIGGLVAWRRRRAAAA